MEVSGEKVKLHLDIDETQNKDKAAWFRYAPPTGNLMYSMPIVGTNANLYFSSERSEDPIVIGCIRKNGSSCESFSDVNNRYFATESGNNLDMLPGAINFSRPGLSANFNDGSGINLSSSSSLNISAGYVGIYAGDITIKAKSKLEAKKGESSFISLENDFYNNAGIVMENGSDKASNGAFDDDPQKGAAEAKKAKEAMESAVKVALAAVVGAVQGAMGKIGECLAGVGNNNVTGSELGTVVNALDKNDMDSLPEYTETHTASEFNNLGSDGVRAKYECNDGTKVTGKVILGSDITPTFVPDDRSEYNKHNSWFSKENFSSMGNGVKASLIQQSNAFIDVFLAAQTPLIGWDNVKRQMDYEHEQIQREVERLRNESPSKRQFDNTNFSANVGFGVYDIVTGIRSVPEIYKTGKSALKLGKSLIENMPQYLDDLKDVIKNGKKIASEFKSNASGSIDDLINSYKGLGKARKIDVVNDADIISDVKNIRQKLPSRYKTSGNLATAEVNIDGINQNKFFAHSGIDKMQDNLIGKADNISVQPDNPMFKAIEAANKNGEFYLRDSCTEYKILNDIADRLNDSVNPRGKIKLFTELEPCDSCKKVIDSFRNEFKNIEIEVIHNGDIRVIPKNGY